jgi:hypothetical protein
VEKRAGGGFDFQFSAGVGLKAASCSYGVPFLSAQRQIIIDWCQPAFDMF